MLTFLHKYIPCLFNACEHKYLHRHIQKHVFQYIAKPVSFKCTTLLGLSSSLNCFRQITIKIVMFIFHIAPFKTAHL